MTRYDESHMLTGYARKMSHPGSARFERKSVVRAGEMYVRAHDVDFLEIESCQGERGVDQRIVESWKWLQSPAPTPKQSPLDWFLSHVQDLKACYGDDWLAIDRDQVVAHAATPGELRERLNELGLSRTFITRIKMTSPDQR